MIVELFAKSDIGRVRRGNEDNFLLLDLSTGRSVTGSEPVEVPVEMHSFDLGPRGLVLVVSDGMGGALAGDVASRMAVEFVRDTLADASSINGQTPGEESDLSLISCLRQAVLDANSEVHRQSLSDARFSGMGATFTGAAVNNRTLDLVQVGDSRAYLVRGNQIKLTTKDQSLVQQLVDVGQITEEDAETHMFKNVILQALGAQSEIVPVTGRVRLCRHDILLLCSDGLSGKLRAEDMHQILTDSGGDLAAACENMVAEANARGGEDNITLILAHFDGADLPAPKQNDISIELLRWPEEDTAMAEEDDEATRSPDAV
ncbi:MAG: protein phosphatase 2C domain-containing protein [Pyrinomonadaceae bacterium]